MTALIEIDGCVFDKAQLRVTHGHEKLDPIAKEAFVNHIHFSGRSRQEKAENQIQEWKREMQKWPDSSFRIYRQIDTKEIIIRFHLVRSGLPNWCDEFHGLEVIDFQP